MNRLSLLAGLVIVTLIVNVVLGIELYYALHRSSQPIGGVPINVSTVQIVSPSSTSASTKNATILNTTTTSKTYSFSFKAEFKIHVKEHGIYLVGIKPSVEFAQLYVILYFEDGQVVSLNLNQTYSNVTINEDNVKIIAYIYGKSYQNLTPQQILNDSGIYFKFIAKSNDHHEDNGSTDDLILVSFSNIARISTFLKYK